MLTVACVLRSGRVYDTGWVARLQRGVAEHTAAPHRFVCLSDVDVPCERIPLEADWPRWWGKVELFRPGLFTGPVVYLDLDTIVTGDVARLARDAGFGMMPDVYRAGGWCSTAMAWSGDAGQDIWDRFTSDPDGYMTRFRALGDQGLVEHVMGDRVTALDGVASYREHALAGPPEWAVAVAFHGVPKPGDATGWARQEWERLAA